MKITNRISSLAAVAIVSVVAACGSKEQKEASSKPVDAKTEVSQQIVYVNSDTLLAKYQYFKDMKLKLETKAKAAQGDMAAKGQAFQREVAQYQQQANTMAADQRAATEERLKRKEQELGAYQQNAGQALQREQAAENEKLYDKIADYLKEYARKKGYKMVLTYSKGNSAILFADESLDVTNEVIKGLNDGYKK
ncbi:OmpH family outer membrane protein [Pedobacter deserti]|uniref:OmpH family outer membrane protein n=1 Tax=Pedobacter deserti TaxID=2817382 RepID=UPI00210E06DB|nr:OmpH family outer membrane protein [Pedobacter sp. SYSU D00382]